MGGRKRASQKTNANAKIANGQTSLDAKIAYRQANSSNAKIENEQASSREAINSPKIQDDKISQLRNLNQVLLNEIKSLRDEKTTLSENLAQMSSKFEAESKIKDRSKEVEKELRKELAKKEMEYEISISKAETQLQEAQQKIQAMYEELEATRKAWELEKYELLSQIVDSRKESESINWELLQKHDHTSKLENFNQDLAKEIESLREQNIILSENVTRLSSEIEAESKLKNEWKDAEKELREQLAKKEAENEAAISKAGVQLQEAQHKVKVMCTEAKATREAWELEKDELLSRIADANKMKDELKKVEKELREHEAATSKAGIQLQESQHKTKAISAEAEASGKAWELEKGELLSQIVAARKEGKELVQKNEQDRHLCDADKRKFEDTLSKLQTKLELTARENKLLGHINEDLSSQVLSLMDELRECNAKLTCLEDEKQMTKAMPVSNGKTLQAMQED